MDPICQSQCPVFCHFWTVLPLRPKDVDSSGILDERAEHTETGINNKSKRVLVSVWPSFAFHIDPQYEKLKVESLAQSSPADSDWLKSDSSSQNHVFKQKASQYPTIVQIDMPQPCNISCFIQSGHCIFAFTKCYCILLQEFTLHSDCLGIVTIPEIYKYVTSFSL